MNKLLIIDSNKDYHLIYKRKLRPLKFSLTFVCSVEEALQSLKKKDFDVVILEHLLKRDFGNEVYERLRDVGYRGPVMVMTYMKNVNRECYNGISKMVNKSISAKDLCDTILMLLSNYSSEKNKTLILQERNK